MTTVVDTPEWAWEMRAVPGNGIHIDSCIADRLVDAWAQGVRTLGSCCGHNVHAPSVVLDDDSDPGLARSVLPGWTLEQWQLRLTDVTLDFWGSA